MSSRPRRAYNTPIAFPQESRVNQSLWKAVLTDAHFWIPVAVLILGIAILEAVR
jgi:hypothetical protein